MAPWVTTIQSHRPKGCNPGRFPYIELDRDEGFAKDAAKVAGSKTGGVTETRRTHFKAGPLSPGPVAATVSERQRLKPVRCQHGAHCWSCWEQCQRRTRLDLSERANSGKEGGSLSAYRQLFKDAPWAEARNNWVTRRQHGADRHLLKHWNLFHHIWRFKKGLKIKERKWAATAQFL